MNEIVQMVSQKVGIPQDKAQQAVELVINQLKSRLPGPIASHLDQFTGGGGGNVGSEASSMLGNVLGEKKAS